ncbi:MAG: hypothetical protein Q9187_005975 [Circinaria calcarea]
MDERQRALLTQLPSWGSPDAYLSAETSEGLSSNGRVVQAVAGMPGVYDRETGTHGKTFTLQLSFTTPAPEPQQTAPMTGSAESPWDLNLPGNTDELDPRLAIPPGSQPAHEPAAADPPSMVSPADQPGQEPAAADRPSKVRRDDGNSEIIRGNRLQGQTRNRTGDLTDKGEPR